MASRGDRACNGPEFERQSQQAPEVIDNRAEAAPQVWQEAVLSPPQQQSSSPEISPARAEKYGTYHAQESLLPHAEKPLGGSESEGKRHGRSSRIAGLPAWAFWLLLIVLGLVIIGASIGGAIGGVGAEKKHDDAAADLTTSTT
nr:hypothetical protein CFP56_64852 [Quercus suber]